MRAGAEHRWLIDVPVARRAGMARESGASVTRESGRQRFLGCQAGAEHERCRPARARAVEEVLSGE